MGTRFGKLEKSEIVTKVGHSQILDSRKDLFIGDDKTQEVIVGEDGWSVMSIQYRWL